MDDMNKPRPPYVKFEVRAVEDRTQSIEAGRYVSKDIIFAIVTPSGTKDRLEKPAEDWLAGIEEGVKQERIPAEWLDAYRRAFTNFKESREDPENGTSVRDWSALSPSQVMLLLDLNIRTVEDVAVMTEEAVLRLGMGGRALKAKAIAWLDSAGSTGKSAAKLEALEQENIELKARNEELDVRLAKLEKLLPPEEVPTEQVNEDDSVAEELED